jgi:hypothetical protein
VNDLGTEPEEKASRELHVALRPLRVVVEGVGLPPLTVSAADAEGMRGHTADQRREQGLVHLGSGGNAEAFPPPVQGFSDETRSAKRTTFNSICAAADAAKFGKMAILPARRQRSPTLPPRHRSSSKSKKPLMWTKTMSLGLKN